MGRLLKIVTMILIVLQALSSCRTISSFFTKGEVVAQVGQERLYRSDIDKIIPMGLASEDSVRMARQYINSWASDRVYLDIAEQQLSKSAQDVTQELEDYRKSLLKYRYEQLYVNERLDTAVSHDNIEDYYNTYIDKFVLARPILKARYLHIAADSPALKHIRTRMSSSDANDLIEADSLAFSAALKFTTWSDKWIDVQVLAREYNMEYPALMAKVNRNWIEVTDTAGQMRLAYVSDIVQKGVVAPLEYCEEDIKDKIISARKQNLIMNLEQDLLREALENGQYKIY